jgi:predicted AAA+ superfamily ATPase
VSPIKRYWRSTSQFEVDALFGEDVAVAIKSSDKLSEKHLRGLRALKEERIFKRYFLVCHERQKRTTEDRIEILP